MIADDSIKHRHIRTVYSVEYAQADVEHCFVVFTSSVGDWFTWSICPWWRHQMETFSALLVPCAGNSPVTDEFPAQRAVTRSFDVFFDLRPNNPLGKQSRGWWFETTSRPLWRHCNAVFFFSFALRHQNIVSCLGWDQSISDTRRLSPTPGCMRQLNPR